jgi:phage/plasmid-associated DNA primase
MSELKKNKTPETRDTAPRDEASGFAKMLNTLRNHLRWRIHLINGNRFIYRKTDVGYYETLVGPENPKDTLRCKMEIRSSFRNIPPSLVDNLFHAIIQDESRLIDGTLFITSREFGIPFLNGVFDFQKGFLRAYQEDDVFCDPVPHHFNTVLNRQHIRFLRKALLEWCGKANVQWMVDLMAYLLYIYPNVENLWVNPFGGGRNGKSSFISLLELILGKHKSVGINLADMNRHTTASFVGKMLIVGRDSDQFVSKRGTSLIKNYSGDKYITVEPKGGFQYDSVVEGKMVVSTNYLIRSQDRTFGWYRRLLPIPFGNTFPLDPTFEKRMIRCLPGIITYLVYRACQYKQGQVKKLSERIPRDIQILRMDTQFTNDRVAAFWALKFFDEDEEPLIDEFLKLHNHNISDAFDAFKDWHHEYFGEDEKVEPGRNSFCGAYGAFIEKAKDYFFTERTRNGRVLYLHDHIYEDWTAPPKEPNPEPESVQDDWTQP